MNGTSLTNMAASVWKSIPCKISELYLDRALACGQSFRWKEYVPGVWTGVIGNAVWQLKQTDSELFYRVYRETSLTQEKKAQGCVKREVKEENDVDTKLTACKKSSRRTKATDLIQNVKVEPVSFLNTLEPSKQEIMQGPVNSAITGETIRQEQKSFCKSSSGAGNTYTPENWKDSDILKDYFQLDINLEDMYKKWSKADTNFEKVCRQFPGIRMLRQDPVECLFSFICSSNNHISRITSMVDKLAEHYGKKIDVTDCVNGVNFYAFPKVQTLAAEGVEEKLRELGFGYRAKYVQQSARLIEEKGGEEWLHSLRDLEYKDAKKNLIQLCGVGAKVADCVALMCLDQPGSIPVDTHVWQIAARDYMPKLKQAKSLNEKLYDEIGDFFRNLWGPYAGWAHSVLFTADLRQFKDGKKESPDKKSLKRKSDSVGGGKPLKRKSDSVGGGKQKSKPR